MILFLLIDSTICSGVNWCVRSLLGSMLISIVLGLPPNGGAVVNPGILIKNGRAVKLAISCSSLFVFELLLKTNCPTGCEEASNRIINGGGAPGGKNTCERLESALISAIACPISVPS